MSKELALNKNLPAQVTESDIEDLKSGGFLPYILCLGSSSDFVKDPKYDLKAGIFVMPKGGTEPENIVTLGEQITVLPLAWRWKALDFSTRPPKVSVYKESPMFQEIKNSSGQGKAWGVEFLCWFPSEETFCTLPCTSKTSRNVAGNDILPSLKNGEYHPYNLSTRFIKTERFSWWGFDAKKSEEDVDVPDLEIIKAKVDSFMKEVEEEKNNIAEDVPEENIPV